MANILLPSELHKIVKLEPTLYERAVDCNSSYDCTNTKCNFFTCKSFHQP